ncbi:MAG: hypothetical protein FWE11_00170 [Defluviitaleaceae bacterium]|nr:hypothetical protein [Defluviitaleaceae bacterium]
MNYKDRGPKKANYRARGPVKSSNVNNKVMVRVLLMLTSLFVVVGIAIFAYDNDSDPYGFIDDNGPVYTYINEYNYEDENNGDQDNHYHDEGYLGQAPEYEDGSFYAHESYSRDDHTYYDLPYNADEEYDYHGGYIGYAPSYIGIQPSQIVGTVTPYANNPVTTHDGLVAAIAAAPANAAADEFFLIEIGHNLATPAFQGFHLTAGITIGTPAGRSGLNIILTTYGTNVAPGDNSAFGTGATALELRQNSGARHFTLTNGARLMLVNIAIDGRTSTGTRPSGTGTHGGIVVNNGTLVMQTNSTIANNRSSTDGGGVHVDGASARFYMFAGTIGGAHSSPTHADDGHGNTIRHPASVTYVINQGAAAAAANTWVTNVGPMLIDRNHATRAGGGVAVSGGGTFIMNDGMIIGNSGRGNIGGTGVWTSAWSAGGVAVIGTNSSVHMHGGYIRGNWSGQNAGGVLVRNSSLSGNVANGPSFHLHGGSIEYNRSSRADTGGTGGGGGVTLSHGAHFYMHGGFIRNNFAVTTGGGVRMRDGSTMTMTGGSIIENNGGGGATTTSFSGGGGIFMESLARGTGDTITLYMYGGRISYNTSRDTRTGTATIGGQAVPVAGGGGIFLRGGDLYFRGPNPKYIEGNTSGTHGGGIIWVQTGFMHVQDNTGLVSISGNHAGYTYNIGAVSAASPGMQLGRDGGGVYVQGHGFLGVNFTIDNNSATGDGGGIYTRSHVTLDGGSVNGNLAGGMFAGVRTNGTARPGQAITPIVGLGGGIQIDGAGSFTATGNATDLVTLDGNSAGLNGGGVNIGGAGAVSFTRTSISDNTVRSATGNGGGINITGAGAITATDSYVDGNDTGQHGGGINAGGTGTVTITRTSISDNIIRNTGDGSGIRNMGAVMTATDSQINENIGAQRGGGVFIAGGTLTINDTTVDGNDAALSGGGVYMGSSNATFTMNGIDSSISGNTAYGDHLTQGGGGVFIEGATGGNAAANVLSPTFVMNNGVIYNNTAIRGGGVFIRGAHRTAGAGLSFGGTFTMNNGYIRGNRAIGGTGANPGGDGGGVFMDGAIRENAGPAQTTGIAHGSRFNMYNGVIENNTAVRNGGGVFLDRGQGAPSTSLGANWARGSEFVMNYGSIRGNTAGYGAGNYGDGGGVFIHGSTLYTNHQINVDSVSRFNLNGGNIHNNTATNGGGVFIQGGRREGTATTHNTGTFEALGGRLTIAGGHVHGNTATQNGGGVFLGGGHRVGSGNGGYANGGAFHMTSGSINNNNAVNGGGIYAGGALDESSGDRIARSADFNVMGGSIVGNTAQEKGGGVYLSGNTLPANTTQSPLAPRFNLNFGGPGTIAHNTANKGGGVYVGGGYRTNDGTLGAGGVIHGAELVISGTGVIGPGNHAYEYGGGVYVAGGVRDGGAGGGATGGILRFGGSGMVQGNTSDGHGGGVALRPGRDIGTGIGIAHSHPGALLSMRGGHILGNIAEYDGGGLWIPNIDNIYTVVPFVSDVVYTTPLVTQPNDIRNNRRLTGANISDNTATNGYGGGIWLGRGLDLYLNGCNVVSNTAGRYGGSVFLHAGIIGGHGANTLTMLGGYLSGSAMRGGGVYIQGGMGDVPGAIFNMNNNAAIPAAGGAPAIAAGSPTIGNPAGSTLARGTASINGGGVYIQGGNNATNAGRFNMHSGAIGAVYPDGTNRGNIALQDGGGLFIGPARSLGAQAAVFNTPGTTARSFVGNDAGQRGGGIFISDDINLILHANTIINNNRARYGGGAWVSPDASMTLQTGGTSSINFNRAYYGGGVWVAPDAELTLETGIAVRGNTALNDGGGVFVAGGQAATSDGGTFTMTGGIIGGAAQNEANTAQRGGGVFVERGSAANHGQAMLTNGEIRGNRAVYGGGVYVDGGAFTMVGGTIHHNIAGNNDDITNIIIGDGGGVWIANHGYLYASNVNFNNNRAIGTIVDDLPVGGMGGAIFTMRHEYRDPMTRVTPDWAGAPATFAYSNIILSGVNNFSANNAVTIEIPPQNAAEAIANSLFGTTSQGAEVTPRHPLNNADINFMHRPEGTFYFFSTDQRVFRDVDPYIHRLAGTQFILFRTISPHVTDAMFNADPDGRLVRFDANGEALSALWMEIPFSCDNYTAISANSPISFDFDARFTYQLVQVMSLPGFQIPMGQWQITYNSNAAAGSNPFNVTVFGGHTSPGLASTDSRFPLGTNHPLPPEHNIWYFGNWPDFELPLSGGTGMSLFIISGSVITAMAVAALVLIVKKNLGTQSQTLQTFKKV